MPAISCTHKNDDFEMMIPLHSTVTIRIGDVSRTITISEGEEVIFRDRNNHHVMAVKCRNGRVVCIGENKRISYRAEVSFFMKTSTRCRFFSRQGDRVFWIPEETNAFFLDYTSGQGFSVQYTEKASYTVLLDVLAYLLNNLRPYVVQNFSECSIGTQNNNEGVPQPGIVLPNTGICFNQCTFYESVTANNSTGS